MQNFLVLPHSRRKSEMHHASLAARGACAFKNGSSSNLGASLSGWPLAQVMDIWHWTGFFVAIAIAAGISAGGLFMRTLRRRHADQHLRAEDKETGGEEAGRLHHVAFRLAAGAGNGYLALDRILRGDRDCRRHFRAAAASR
jgi:hypothetical protein